MSDSNTTVDVVCNTWMQTNQDLEGVAYVMYLDTHVPGLVTTGMGNYIPLAVALQLPWLRYSDNQPATPDEITAEWNAVDSDPNLGREGLPAAQQRATLYLTPDAVNNLIETKYDSDLSYIQTHYVPCIASLPPNAVWVVMSLSWGMGPGFGSGYPHFIAAINSGDWAIARDNCHMNGSPTPDKRNKRGFDALDYLAKCAETGDDPSQFTVLSSINLGA